MGVWRGLVWAFARNTEAGRKALGRETLAEQAVRERMERERIAIVDTAYRKVQSKYQPGAPELQYLDGEYRVTVKSGYSFQRGVATTEILIFPRKDNPRGSHWHVVIDESGNELMSEWREK